MAIARPFSGSFLLEFEALAKADWGSKHSCQNCGAKYYDLNRSPATCPKCGTTFNPDALLRSRRGRAKEESKPAPVVKTKAAVVAKDVDDEYEALADDDEDGDKVIEDVSELVEDDSDVVEVVVEDEKDDS